MAENVSAGEFSPAVGREGKHRQPPVAAVRCLAIRRAGDLSCGIAFPAPPEDRTNHRFDYNCVRRCRVRDLVEAQYSGVRDKR